MEPSTVHSLLFPPLPCLDMWLFTCKEQALHHMVERNCLWWLLHPFYKCHQSVVRLMRG